MLATSAGAIVSAISKRRTGLDYAKEFGAQQSITMSDHLTIVKKVNEITNGLGCDKVIESTGLQWPIDLVTDLLRVRGTLIIAGYHQDGIRSVNMQVWNWKGIDVINAHERDSARYIAGLKNAIIVISSGLLNPSKLYTHVFTLDTIEEVFEKAVDRPECFLKALAII